MTFDPYANQGGAAAWDPAAAAASKKAADELFGTPTEGAEPDDEGIGTEGDEDVPRSENGTVDNDIGDDDQPYELPDPDITTGA